MALARALSPVLTVLFCASWLAACAGDGAEGDAAVDSDAGASALADAGMVACSPTSTVPECPTPMLSFSGSDQRITPVRDHHTTLIAGAPQPFLYVFGGTDSWDVVHSDILRAPIQGDGSLGPFEAIGALPRPLAGHTTVLVDDTLVVSGGLTVVDGERFTSSETYLARLGPDGTIGSWREGPLLPVAVMHHTCDAHARRVYCVGGRIAGNLTGTLATFAELDEAGTLTEYQPMPALPQSIGFHQSFVYKGALYVAGGLHRDARNEEFERVTAVLRSALTSDGPSPWEGVAELPYNVQIGAAAVVGDDVYLIGGMDDADRLRDTVLRATIDSTGALVDFETIEARLTVARGHVHQAPLHDNRIYFVGGRNGWERSLDVIDIGLFEMP